MFYNVINVYLNSLKQKNVSYLLRLRFLRYRQTPVLLKRVRAHALRREPSTLLLQRFLKFGEFQITRFSGRFNVFLFSFSLLCYHKRFVFRVRHYLLVPSWELSLNNSSLKYWMASFRGERSFLMMLKTSSASTHNRDQSLL